MFKIEDTVKVTDQKPPAEGTVIAVSTWREVFEGKYGTNDICYRIQSPDWGGSERWIDGVFVKAA